MAATAIRIPKKKDHVESMASPRTGRPAAKHSMFTETLPEVHEDLAFNVPETPPGVSLLDRKYFKDSRTPSPPAPFPAAADDEARHEICVDSLRPWTYLLAVPGKNVRDVLIDAFNAWLQVDKMKLSVVKQVVGYLHTASLIIDDIEDESDTRRGEPSAHIVYGIAPALNAGNYVYFLALEKLLSLQSTDCVQVFTAEMLNLHRGQGRDIFWRTSAYLASEEEYCQMVCDKTGGLFRLAIRVMQVLSTNAEERMIKKLSAMSMDSIESQDDPVRRLRTTSSFLFSQTSDFTSISNQLACYFQIRDDLINLASPKFHKMKGFCEDVTEGKLSFIALHSLRKYRDNGDELRKNALLKLLQAKTTDKNQIKEALRLMDNTGSFDYTIKYLETLVSDIKISIEQLGGNPMLLKLVCTLAMEVDDCHDVRGRVIDA